MTVVFMLLERRDLRDRLIGLFGHGHLAVTTKAFDEAATRVSRQLLMQSLVNLVYGVAAGVGLYLLGVPYPVLWASLGAALRFIPYVGPVLGAGAPIVVSLAALDGWTRPFEVMALFVVLELFTNLVLETLLYAGAAGVSQVALLTSVAFWTWLWGPLGLLMATPLTVCLVVLGKHVPGLEFVGLLMADTPPLAPEHGYYQRLLARDQGEAADLIDRHIKTEPPRSVYDVLLLPALNYAERDRLEERLSQEEELIVIEATRELLSDAADSIRRAQPTPGADAPPRSSPESRSVCWATPATALPTRSRSRCSLTCSTICPSALKSPTRGCWPRNWSRWCGREGFRSCASRICRPALLRRRAIWSRGSARRFRSCEFWSAGGRRRPWPTRARSRCGTPARITWPRRWRRRASTSVASRRFRGSPFQPPFWRDALPPQGAGNHRRPLCTMRQSVAVRQRIVGS